MVLVLGFRISGFRVEGALELWSHSKTASRSRAIRMLSCSMLCAFRLGSRVSCVRSRV